MARKSLRTVRSALAQKLASQPPMDLPFLLLILTLVAFGLIMLGSASWAVGLYRRGDAYAYLRPQLLFAAVGLAALWALAFCFVWCTFRPVHLALWRDPVTNKFGIL